MEPTPDISVTPPEVAINKMAEQLNSGNLENAMSALRAIQQAAFHTDIPQLRVKALEALSKFASHYPEGDKQMELRKMQGVAREKIASIAFGSEQEEVKLAAVQGLSRSLGIPALSSNEHWNTIQLIAIISSVSESNQVKNTAIESLARYSSSPVGGGYYGRTAHPEAQQYANLAVGVISKPANQ